MRADFGLSVDWNDPYSIIGCLKYSEKVREGDEVQMQRTIAKRMLIRGVDHFSVADHLGWDEKAIIEIVREVEAEGHLVQSL